MNVFVLSTWCPFPMVNGSTLRAGHLVRALAVRHEVDLVAFPAPAPPDGAALAELRACCRDVTVLPADPFVPRPGRSGGWLSSTPASLHRSHDPAIRDLVRARASAADVAIGFQLPAARYLDDVSRPVIFEEAEPGQIAGQIAAASTPGQALRRRLTWWKQARYLAALSARMRAVTVVSTDERRQLLACGVDGTRVHVVPNGADEADVARPRAVADPPRLVYSGAITYGPNHDAVRWFLERVMPDIHRVRPDVDFWVTGDTGRVALDELPNRHLARFTGRLPDVKAAVGDAAVAVVPLLSGGGTRLKVLEAMALGTPVVSTAKGVEGLDVVAGRDVLVADTPAAFAAQVLRLLAEPPLAAGVSAAARRLVATSYAWTVVGRRLVEIVDAVAQGPVS
jgi:glycosyltransferase involved in cell wall biosynthesis